MGDTRAGSVSLKAIGTASPPPVRQTSSQEKAYLVQSTVNYEDGSSIGITNGRASGPPLARAVWLTEASTKRLRRRGRPTQPIK